jgi:hypothetical protein
MTGCASPADGGPGDVVAEYGAPRDGPTDDDGCIDRLRRQTDMSQRILGIAALAVMLPVGASAQQSQPQASPPPQPSSTHLLGRATLSLGAASAVTLGSARDRFTNGAELLMGVSYPVKDRFAVQFDYAVSFHDVKAAFFPDVETLRGTSRMQQFNFDGRWALSKPDDRVQFFVLGGPGVYKRSVKITAYDNSSVVCDPYLLNCEVDTVADEIGSRHTWGAGVNVGGGFSLPMSSYLQVAFEMRYIHIWGPTVSASPSSGATTTVNGNFLPLVISFRF